MAVKKTIGDYLRTDVMDLIRPDRTKDQKRFTSMALYGAFNLAVAATAVVGAEKVANAYDAVTFETPVHSQVSRIDRKLSSFNLDEVVLNEFEFNHAKALVMDKKDLIASKQYDSESNNLLAVNSLKDEKSDSMLGILVPGMLLYISSLGLGVLLRRKDGESNISSPLSYRQI